MSKKLIDIKTAVVGELVRYKKHSPLEIVLGFSTAEMDDGQNGSYVRQWVHLLSPGGEIVEFPADTTNKYEALLRK